MEQKIIHFHQLYFLFHHWIHNFLKYTTYNKLIVVEMLVLWRDEEKYIIFGAHPLFHLHSDCQKFLHTVKIFLQKFHVYVEYLSYYHL